MKKGLLLGISTILLSWTNAQVVISSNFENWNATNDSVVEFGGTKSSIYPAGTSIGITKVATGGVYGPSSAQLKNTTTSHKRLASDKVSVTEFVQYEIKFWARGTGDIRSGLYDNDLGNGDFGYKYGSYVTLDPTNWTEFTQQIIADTTTTDAEFLLSVRNTTGSHVEVDSFVVNTGTIITPTNSTIYQIQYTTNVSGDSPLKDQNVNTGGIVMATAAKGYWIQDASAAWSGIYVFDSITQPAIGDSLTLSAKVVEFNNLTELTFANSIVKVSSGNTPYAALLVSTMAANDEQYEGVFVRVENAQVNTNLSGGRFLCSDGSGDVMVDDFLYFYPLPGQTDLFTFIQGIMDYSFSERKLQPRSAADMNNAGADLDEAAADLIQVYPNSVKDQLTIKNAGSTVVRVIGVDGKVWKEMKLNAATETIQMDNLSAGAYIIQISADSVVRNFRIIKQ